MFEKIHGIFLNFPGGAEHLSGGGAATWLLPVREETGPAHGGEGENRQNDVYLMSGLCQKASRNCPDVNLMLVLYKNGLHVDYVRYDVNPMLHLYEKDL